jgi:hypothetical protein
VTPSTGEGVSNGGVVAILVGLSVRVVGPTVSVGINREDGFNVLDVGPKVSLGINRVEGLAVRGAATTGDRGACDG